MQFTQKSRSSLPLDRADGLGREVVTHAADAGGLGGDAEVGHHGEVLSDGKTGLVDLLADDCVGLAQCLEAVAGDGTQAANAQASRGAAVCSMTPAVSLRQWNQVAALDNSPDHRPSGDGPGTGPTRGLEMSGGFRTFFNGWRFLNLLESRINRMTHVYPPLIHT